MFQCGAFCGGVGKDDGVSPWGYRFQIAKPMFLQFASLPVREQSLIDNLLQIFPVRQIEITAAGSNQFTPAADLNRKERQAHYIIHGFSRDTLLKRRGGNGAHHADTLHLHALPGEVDHHTKDAAQQHHDDCHDNANKLNPKSFDQDSFTSK